MSLKFIVAAAVTVCASVVARGPILAQVGKSTEQTAQAYSRGMGDTSIFAPLALFPGPNVYRSGSGAPGAKYWQNKADYDLRVTLDTGAQSITGSMTLRYTNHSPDTLTFIWFQTEQNAFRPHSINSLVFPANSRFGGGGFVGGEILDQVTQIVGGKSIKLSLRDNETTTKVDLAKPLPPGQTATIEVKWHFLIPEHGADRMGRDGSLYEIAQWYPRVCVYDDVRGWNTEPYLGQSEFYLEYGDYSLAVTVPATYVVAATGMLANPHDVLTTQQITRLAQAAKSDKPVPIITDQELSSGAAHLSKTGTKTWKFTAKNVRDAVWAASPNFQWDASSWHGIMAYAYYRPSAVDTWGHGESVDMARMSIKEYSERWFLYPYPQISVVEGPISGMEYPMLAMESRSGDKYDLYGVITHEIGHQWFPMIVGSNERMNFWQDEGFNTFINTFSEALRFPEGGDQIARAQGNREGIEQVQQANADVPIVTQADRINPNLLGYIEYLKPAVGLQLLRHEILGDSVFDDAFRTYIKQWAFKHPTPTDFYRTMESVSGRRLDWFWRGWFLEDPKFDQAIGSVETEDSRVVVHFANRARGVLPIHARFTFKDGTKQDFKYPAEVWSTNSTSYARQYDFGSKVVTQIELDPDNHLVDVDRANNSWKAPAPASQ